MIRPPSHCLLALVALAASPASAQWLNQPTRGDPAHRRRQAESLGARAESRRRQAGSDRTVALGIEIGYAANITADLAPGDIQPWARALSRRSGSKTSARTIRRSPAASPAARVTSRAAGLAKIIQTPSLIVILFEDLSYRQIFLDGRQLPRDPNPSWMGYSVGHWEGDTLVVDDGGLQRSHVARLRRPSAQRGAAHHRALPAPRFRPPGPAGHARRSDGLREAAGRCHAGGSLAPDTELIEYVCAENEKDRVAPGRPDGGGEDGRRCAGRCSRPTSACIR